MIGIQGKVGALFIYPLKSAAPVQIEHIAFDELGAVYDRRWVLVDPEGKAITQRDTPRLALIRPTLVGDPSTLLLRAPGQSELMVGSSYAEEIVVNVWNDRMSAFDAGEEAAEWCSIAADVPCRLVCFSPHAKRPLAGKYAGFVDCQGRHVAFTDGAPALLLGDGSLEELNRRLSTVNASPIGVERFRPNIFITGLPPHAEDAWLDVRIGEMRFGVGSLCPRCVIPTIDQNSGRRAGHEPLRTLATYRKRDGEVMFGVNATHSTIGSIAVGDMVEAIRLKTSVPEGGEGT